MDNTSSCPDPNTKPVEFLDTSTETLILCTFGPSWSAGICPICTAFSGRLSSDPQVMRRRFFVCEPIIKSYQQKRDALVECSAEMNQLDTITMWKHLLIELQIILKIEDLSLRQLHDHITQHLAPWPEIPGRPKPLPWQYKGPVGLGYHSWKN